MNRFVNIAALQLPPSSGDNFTDKRQNNINNALDYLFDAGQRGCDIACLPEAFSTYGCEYGKHWETIPGAVIEQLAERANRFHMYVIAPLTALVDGIKRNTAVIINREGRVIGQYYKTHLTQPELDAGCIPGDDLPVFDLDFGRIGIMTCLDNQFPETARVLSVRGAEVIFYPHVESGWGEVGWMAQLISRAIDNCVYLVPVTFGMGINDPWMPGTIMGRSGVIGYDGIPLVSAGRLTGVVNARVDLDQRRWVRSFGVAGLSDYKQHAFARRRPEIYRSLIE